MSENLLFTYGSLMRGLYNHHHLRQARFIGEGITHPVFELVDLGAYPAMVLDGKTAIHGEVYAVEEETLARIDRLESHPSYYVRSQITLQDGAEVWVYLMRKELVGMRPRIASGNWKNRQPDESSEITVPVGERARSSGPRDRFPRHLSSPVR